MSRHPQEAAEMVGWIMESGTQRLYIVSIATNDSRCLFLLEEDFTPIPLVSITRPLRHRTACHAGGGS